MTNGKKPVDESQPLVDAAYDDASDVAGEEADDARPAAHRLAQLGLAMCDELDAASRRGVVVASGEQALQPDTGRILAMDRDQLVALIADLRALRGEAADPVGGLTGTSDEHLRELARWLRSSAAQ